ncbi:tyrosine-type recombinase/integrase [Candidatus Bathyarchaeota archaeon]|nr:tyrosine-type recombinase/integrase [Candidatus Bathyarchaeota archaeon]MBS7613273.1 tyrosine-type recombinase/integrase [Candidatus Bathyarchaeota archaeon]MBS7617652.1 tyrosine-type recombinase/integrase [Candidatus Bathyarchaeota archaeon]
MQLQFQIKTYVKAYDAFLKFVKGSWEMPKFKVKEKMPFIPTEEELDQLIAGCGRKTSTLLQLLKETGARLGKALKLKWTDVDFERRLVKITPEKGSRPRILPISLKLIEMLNILPRENEKIFPAKKGSWKKSFINQRNRLAVKLGNPRLKNITFHIFRHWKGTTEYHRNQGHTTRQGSAWT